MDPGVEWWRSHPRSAKWFTRRNQLESINYQLRKVTENRGHFPTEKAALKLLYLAIRDITTTRAGDTGTGTWGWKACLNAMAIYFPGRFTIV